MNKYFFGCWGQAGHYVFGPHGVSVGRDCPIDSWVNPDWSCLDGGYAPRYFKPGYTQVANDLGLHPGSLVWQAMGKDREQRNRIGYDSNEALNGMFLLHNNVRGYSILSWWDNNQGDTRGGCNSNVIVEDPKATLDAVYAVLKQDFTQVLNNLRKYNVDLIDARTLKGITTAW